MATKVQIDGISNAINEALKEYSDEMIDATKEVVDEITDEAVKVVQENAPQSKTNKYRKSIKSKTLVNNLTKKINAIHADNGQYRLTHLLEYGHATVIKDGTYGGTTRTKATPHFQQGEEYIAENLEKRIKEKI